MIDPMRVAEMRQQVAARQQLQSEAQQKNALRSLLTQTVTPDGQINQNALGAFLQSGGDVRDVAAMRQAVVGPRETAQWTTPKVIRDVVRDNKPGQIVLTPDGERFEPYPDKPETAPKPQKPGDGDALPRGKRIDLEIKLAKDYEAQSKDYLTVKKQADIIKAALNDPSAIGTLASATAVMKMLDPGSVVRESELGMAMKSTGALDRLGNLFNVVSSGQVLTDQQKREFAGLVDNFVKAYDQAQMNLNTRFANRANSYGLDVGNIVTIPLGAPGELGVSGVPASKPKAPAPGKRPPLAPMR